MYTGSSEDILWESVLYGLIPHLLSGDLKTEIPTSK